MILVKIICLYLYFLSALTYPNATTCFFVELFNFYQKLSTHSDYPYRSFSQSITTYCLKELKRKNFIYFIMKQKASNANLQDYMEMLGNYDYKNVTIPMHCYYFRKKRSLTEEDIPLLQSMTSLLNIDFSNLKIVSKEDKIYLRLKAKYVWYEFLTGKFFKNMYNQKEIFYLILDEYKDYFLMDQGVEEVQKIKK